ncbi:NADPH-dependent 2,4-dienoyl-CoA reductase/sulfur reductase-like enzyme [Allocatelliglobosispora scoriae]|uniref:NADPH-dependent 2,4-dienoyl-CoA reductase/sulfur reductase-like enzyme n=1 Tax=Allocatelliglobosispora scoriae TaxID=643052 RepID=A0A841BSL1_9ACTN|nr:NAD(P)/FAD-dependent oxidoreductase [Allocatelliglobosispora scoriae]MBB5870169.1 NADPH-dependent 2,4-dienoyl-CoA reductase/sulfur reductase-like enzyme [Allocatelliglobosispora scoriae]
MSVFCGIGVCQACVVDGERPCLSRRSGAVGSDPHALERQARLVVIGAGPAGLSAAIAAADAGLDVVVVDRGARPGGARRPAALIKRAEQHERIHLRLGVDVWRALPDRTLHLTDGAELRPAALILATGAYDRVVPFPGWELPGVITVGGAQAQLKQHGVPRGQRILVAGRGPLLQVAAAGLAAGGAHVVAVADGVPLRKWFGHWPVVARSPRRLLQAAWLRFLLLRHGLTLLPSHELIAADAAGGALRVTVGSSPKGLTKTFDVDLLAVGDGFTPQVELAIALGAATRIDPRDGSVVVVERDQRTTAPGVFVAGEAAGVGGADQAAAMGILAGLAAARHLGVEVQIPARLRRRVASLRRFADALHDVTRIDPGFTAGVADSTILCRCEGVTFGEARAAVADLGVDDPRSLKLVTRVGMGACQGRLCGGAAADLLGADPTPYQHRPVAVPVPLALFASGGHE